MFVRRQCLYAVTPFTQQHHLCACATLHFRRQTKSARTMSGRRCKAPPPIAPASLSIVAAAALLLLLFANKQCIYSVLRCCCKQQSIARCHTIHLKCHKVRVSVTATNVCTFGATHTHIHTYVMRSVAKAKTLHATLTHSPADCH